MRLIDVDTLEIKTFYEQDVPDYAILSHTWGPDEVTFQEMSLITRMRSISPTFSSQRPEDSEISMVESGPEPGAVKAAMEMLMHAGLGASMNMPDTAEEALMMREGYRKIIHSARESRKLGYRWVWVDVCLPLQRNKMCFEANFGLHADLLYRQDLERRAPRVDQLHVQVV